jgi:hypothetical protein
MISILRSVTFMFGTSGSSWLNGTHNSVNPLNRYNAVTKEYERGDFRKMFKLHGNLSGEYEKVRAS